MHSDLSSWNTLEEDAGNHLTKFEGYFREELLMLREDKLSLMAEQNTIMDKKFQIQLELIRLRRQKDQSQKQ